MTKYYNLCLLIALVAFTISPVRAGEEITFKLEPHQKILGTYSGDIDQKTSLHLVLYKDKNTEDFRIKPFFIDEKNTTTSLSELRLKEEPSIVSYHFDRDSSRFTLLVNQGKKRDQSLEIIDFKLVSNTVSSSTLGEYEEAQLVMRTPDKTFLIHKEKKGLRITTVQNSNDFSEVEFRFTGEALDQFRTIFKFDPETVNTNEYVEHGSIHPSKAYFSDGKLMFDYRDEKKYVNLALDPQNTNCFSFREFDLEDIRKVKDITTYVYGSKVFLFINNKKDILLRAVDLESGQRIEDIQLRGDLAKYFDPEVLEKLIRKSSRARFSLTGTVNEGPDNTMIITLDYVRMGQYMYNYNWWWHHQFLQQHMMWQQQMMRTHMQMQMNSFGPNPPEYIPLEMAPQKMALQFVLDPDFKFLDLKEIKTLRPKIEKDKYLKPFHENRKMKDLSVAFTTETARMLYFSKDTDSFHLKSFEL